MARAHLRLLLSSLMLVSNYSLVCLDPLRPQIKTEKSDLATQDLKLTIVIERSWRMHPRNFCHENYFFKVNLANHENFSPQKF